MTANEDRALQAELDELERTDPDVWAAAEFYDRMVEKIMGRATPDTSPTPDDRCTSRYRPSPIQCALDAHTSGPHWNEWRSWEDEDAIGPDKVTVDREEYEQLTMDFHRVIHQGAQGSFVWIVCNCGAEITRSGTTTWHSIFGEHLRDVRAALSEPQPAPACLCDGGVYGPQAQPFLIHPDCPVHRPLPHPAQETQP